MIKNGIMELDNGTVGKTRGLIVFTVMVVVARINYRRLVDVAAGLIHIVRPFILGATITFILNAPMRSIKRHLPVFGEDSRLRRPVSLVMTILLVIRSLFLIVLVVVPQLIKILLSLQGGIPTFFAGVCDEARHIFTSNPQILEYMNQLEVDWQKVFQNMAAFLKNGAGTMLNTTFSTAVSIVSGVSSPLIGFIFAIYILLRKEMLGRQMKKVLATFLPEPAVRRILNIMALMKHTFSNFPTGQRVEVVILETMFFVTLTVIRLSYALLIRVLIASTALIPIFGVLVGLVVGVLLMLMVNPADVLAFAITFFVLQQIEGSLICPYAVRNSMRLPSIWVLVAVTADGSMMGIMRMLIFIPLCSILCALLRDGVSTRPRRKGRGESVCEPVCVAASEGNGDQEYQEQRLGVINRK